MWYDYSVKQICSSFKERRVEVVHHFLFNNLVLVYRV